MILGLLPPLCTGKIGWDILLFIVGLALIIKGGDIFVDAAVWFSDVLGIPKFLIGATVVSLATTLPELLVSIFAVVDGEFEIGVGNAVGSVTANTGLILALSAIFVGCCVKRKEFGIKGAIILAIGIILETFTLITGKFDLIPSFILAIILVIYVILTIKEGKKTIGVDTPKCEQKPKFSKYVLNIGKFILGAMGIVMGAQLLVDNAKSLATLAHISEGIIAITIVAVGTSLPELVTTITSIVKKQGDLGVGNVIGANIIDLLLILPICSFISKGNLEVGPQAYILDIPAMLAISLVAVVPTLFKKKFTLVQGIIMLLLYITYIVLAAVFFVAA